MVFIFLGSTGGSTTDVRARNEPSYLNIETAENSWEPRDHVEFGLELFYYILLYIVYTIVWYTYVYIYNYVCVYIYIIYIYTHFIYPSGVHDFSDFSCT